MKQRKLSRWCSFTVNVVRPDRPESKLTAVMEGSRGLVFHSLLSFRRFVDLATVVQAVVSHGHVESNSNYLFAYHSLFVQVYSLSQPTPGSVISLRSNYHTPHDIFDCERRFPRRAVVIQALVQKRPISTIQPSQHQEQQRLTLNQMITYFVSTKFCD